MGLLQRSRKVSRTKCVVQLTKHLLIINLQIICQVKMLFLNGVSISKYSI